MMNLKSLTKKYFKSTEEVISMFLGLVIVVVVIGLIFNFYQKMKGNVAIPGVTNNIKITENVTKSEDSKDVYKVVKDDNLWKIAVKVYNDGYAWTKIATANKIKNPSYLEVGQELILPNIEKKEIVSQINSSDKSEVVSAGEYKVVRADSLWKIAVRNYGDGYQWVKIYQVNKSKINNPNKLEIGMTLIIPSLK